MGKFLLIIGFLFFNLQAQAQIKNDSIDTKYLEDQIYLSLTYKLLNNKPSEISQNGFSGGLTVGFIKDFPLNNQRNFGLGLGIGYAYNAAIQNLKISTVNEQAVFEIAQDFNTNKWSSHAIEVPLEIRWRNSTPIKYKFWRVYGGVKLAYLFAVDSKYRDAASTLSTKNSSAFNNWQYGLTLATGYSTWNLYMYYGLSPIFDNAILNNNELKIRDFNVGIKFYIM